MLKFSNPPHPLGIKPLGNAFLADSNCRDNLGTLAYLPDELVLNVCGFFSILQLVRFGSLSKACYAFASFEELWKNLVVKQGRKGLVWRGTWKKTALNIEFKEVHIHMDNLFSDILYRPFMNAFIDFSGLLVRDNIPRLSTLNYNDFSSKWFSQPFILQGVVPNWKAFQWDIDFLVKRYGECVFRAECVDWTLRVYVDYLRNNHDESPLYLFDSNFALKDGGAMGEAYQTPEVLGKDYFEVLGDDRPDYRWLIIGPARSGSTFHKDPNATSAWNAAIKGEKFWVMFPPGQTPPGVFVSKDEAQVTSPCSVAEWISDFLPEARRMGCLEGICRSGELLHIPSGWWHLVVNLSESIAITQNFVPEAHLPKVLSFLKYKPDQVSGFKNCNDVYQKFEKQLSCQFADVLARVKKEAAGAGKRKWHQMRDSNLFYFGFDE